jgi:hypothetical protein
VGDVPQGPRVMFEVPMLTTKNSQEPEDQGPSTQHEGVLYFGIFCAPLSYLISPPGTASAPDDEAPQTPIGAHQTLPDSPGAESFASPSFTSNSSLPRTPPSLAGRRCGSPRVGRHCESRWAQRQVKRKGAQDVNTFFKSDGGFKACIFCQFVTLCLIIFIPANTSFRKAHAIDANYEVARYSKSTSTTVLRKHLCDCHADTWISSCTELNINITAKAAQSTVNAYRRKHEGFSQPTEENGAEHIRQTYSKEAFLDALVDFIVSDDQV